MKFLIALVLKNYDAVHIRVCEGFNELLDLFVHGPDRCNCQLIYSFVRTCRSPICVVLRLSGMDISWNTMGNMDCFGSGFC